jgi:hypothetical protein
MHLIALGVRPNGTDLFQLTFAKRKAINLLDLSVPKSEYSDTTSMCLVATS